MRFLYVSNISNFAATYALMYAINRKIMMLFEPEKPSRQAPKFETLRKLYVLSGNLCAYPGCNKLLLDANANFVGQICHIEAASPGGERFNPNMTNEERRHFDNLMLMCYDHHIETNKVAEYPVERLKSFKREHEAKFSTEALVQSILNSLRDYTEHGADFEKVKSLENLFDTLYPPNNQSRRPVEEIERDCDAFNQTIEQYLKLSLLARRLFLIGLKHSHHPFYTKWRLDTDVLYVDFSEIANKLNMTFRLNRENDIGSLVDEIESNGLMHVSEFDVGYDRIVPRYTYTAVNPKLEASEFIWLYIKDFCEKTNKDVVSFVSDLDFSELDEPI